MNIRDERPTVLLADDHQLFLQSLAHLLEHRGGYRVAGMATSGTGALALARTHRPDIALLDLHMPPPNGLELGGTLRGTGLARKVVLITMHHSASLERRVKALGLDGYLLKNTGADELLGAMRTVLDGGQWFPLAAARTLGLPDDRPELTARELDVLRGIAMGHTSARVAEDLGIALRTVETHRKNINQKLATNKVSDLVQVAQRMGLV